TEKEKYAILRQPVTIELANTGDKAFPNGDFYFKVIARDEAGALSSSNILTGEGVCQIVINHDPDTRIRGGLAHYVMQDGTPVEREIDFRDGEPDTLPYNSTMLIEYFAWDDPKDIPTLQYQNPPLPLRFQFRYKRWAEGGRAMKLSPWYPLGGAEDTNPFADLDDERRDIDSTSIRVGTFDYEFFARSFDEQYRSDGTPDVISFVGNYPPSVDSIRIGFWEPDTLKNYGVKFFQEIPNDTLYIGWRGLVNEIKLNRGDTCYIDTVKIDMVRRKITKYYKFVLRGFGHDDYRDPPGSGVKGWQFFIDSDGGNYNFKKEGDWLFEYAKNFMEHELFIKITVPFEQALTDSVVNDPPAYFGDQQLSVTGIDIKDVEIFKEGIRGISPEFEGDSLTSPGDWVLLDYRLSNYARSDTLRSMFYIKMVY
ncbi:MAG: hypothetical protein KAX38_09275, partial [Candidatus Krumholzibacteria bacterium]|nr:hypothetical protein [Candidatus Krumholzibacteria bacterium]